MRTALIHLQLLAFLIYALPAAHAEEDVSARERFLAKVGSFSAPSDADAFKFEGAVMLKGTSVGGFRYEARPTEENGRSVWRLAEEISGPVLVVSTVTIAKQDVDAIRGSEVEEDPEVRRDKSFVRMKTSVKVTRTESGGEATTSEIAVQGHCMAGALPSIILFARRALPDSGRADGAYEVQLFVPGNAETGAVVRTGSVVMAGPGKWEGVNAYIVRYRDVSLRLRMAFDPTSKDLLGFESGPFKHVVGAKPARAAAQAYFDEHPTSPEQAALQAMLAFITEDAAMVDRLTHWETVYANLSEELRGEGGVEEVRRSGLKKMRSDPDAAPYRRSQIEAALSVLRDQLETTRLENGWTRVTLPALMRGAAFDLVEVGGRWYLARDYASQRR